MARHPRLATSHASTGAGISPARPAARRSSRFSSLAGAPTTARPASRSSRRRESDVPELPEVETTARGLRERLLGRKIVTVGSLDWPRMAPNASVELLAQTAIGRTIESIARRGKYVIVGLSGDAYLVLHRKMSGNLVLRTTDLPIAAHTHLTVTFDDGWRLDFVDPRKFGRIYLFLGRDALDTFLDERLGPEPLEIERRELDRSEERRVGKEV